MRETELTNTADYFHYIGHQLDRDRLLKASLWRWIIGNLFNDISPLNDGVLLRGDNRTPLFRNVIIHGLDAQKAVADNPGAVAALISRHRSLYDYGIGMPVHSQFLNQEVMIVAGSNLFVAAYESVLRQFGAVMFLRDDAVIKRRGYPPVPLSSDRYLNDVFPAYLKAQMFDGVGSEKIKHDLIIYPEQEKNPLTRKRDGGRTKTGKLRDLSPIFFAVFRQLTMESTTKLYITPVNVSFSSYPDAVFLTHPLKSRGLAYKLRYVHEQNFIASWYPRYALRHPTAKLEAVVNYGKPVHFSGEDFPTMRNLIRFGMTLKKQIGLLESVFPAIFLFRALDTRSDMGLAELGDRAKRLFDRYNEKNVNLEKISEKPGHLLPIGQLVDRAVADMNIHPRYRIFGLHTKELAQRKSGRFVSPDPKLQAWYANNLRHLDV